MIVLRFVAFFILMLSGLTLIKPKTGWGRLVCFIPKLFVGSMISVIGLLGLCSSVLGLIFADVWLIRFGLVTVALSGRHIYRIIKRSLSLGKSIAQVKPLQSNISQKTTLSYPWRLRWTESSDGISFKQDVAIAVSKDTGKVLLADLWQSANPGSRSGLGILYLHGSGWHYADKDFGTRHFFRHLAQQGHVITDLAYTLAPKVDLFGMVADIKHAIDWMKQHSSSLGIRSERIILMGGSAGGHLALLAGYTPNHPKFDPPDLANDTSVYGVVSYYGPPNLRAQFERFAELPGLTGRTRVERIFMNYLETRFGFEPLSVHSLLPKLLGGTPAEVPELYDLGSPDSHIGTHCPPTLLLQGLHDFSGAAPEVSTLHHALRSVRCAAYLLELPDTEHGFDLYRPQWSPAAQSATYVTDRFLAALI